MLRLIDISGGEFIAIFAMAIPVVAIVGGITAGIVRTISRQRIIEMAQRERIAAIERGVDPSKLPPLPDYLDPEAGWQCGTQRSPQNRAQGLMVGGIVTLAVGIGVSAFLYTMPDGREAWGVGIIPILVGVALLVSAWLVSPRNGNESSQDPRLPR